MPPPGSYAPVFKDCYLDLHCLAWFFFRSSSFYLITCYVPTVCVELIYSIVDFFLSRLYLSACTRIQEERRVLLGSSGRN